MDGNQELQYYTDDQENVTLIMEYDIRHARKFFRVMRIPLLAFNKK